MKSLSVRALFDEPTNPNDLEIGDRVQVVGYDNLCEPHNDEGTVVGRKDNHPTSHIKVDFESGGRVWMYDPFTTYYLIEEEQTEENGEPDLVSWMGNLEFHKEIPDNLDIGDLVLVEGTSNIGRDFQQLGVVGETDRRTPCSLWIEFHSGLGQWMVDDKTTFYTVERV